MRVQSRTHSRHLRAGQTCGGGSGSRVQRERRAERQPSRGGQGAVKGTGRDSRTQARWPRPAGAARDSAPRGPRTLGLGSAAHWLRGGVALPPRPLPGALGPASADHWSRERWARRGWRGSGSWSLVWSWHQGAPCYVITDLPPPPRKNELKSRDRRGQCLGKFSL